jgi:hypothetical protein
VKQLCEMLTISGLRSDVDIADDELIESVLESADNSLSFPDSIGLPFPE